MKIKYIVLKIANRIKRRKILFLKYLPKQFLSIIGSNNRITKDLFFMRLRTILGCLDESLFSNISEYEAKSILLWANHTLAHEFDYLGSGIVKLDPISWNKDYKTGYEWPRETFICDLPPYPLGSDIKVPWELSRGHHLLWLGEAYLITGDDKYAQEVIHQIDNWIDNNPLLYSVNWTCAMEAAIRSVNWMYALSFISDYNGLTDSFANKVYKSLKQHLFFIENMLERDIPYSNNHYSSDVVGILFLQTLFDNGWKRTAKVLFNDVRIQVFSTGVHYERSVSYHRLMTELYGYSASLLVRMGESLPEDVSSLIQKMYNYVDNYIKPSGKAPLVGDNDDGRFLPFVKREFRNHSYLVDATSLENRISRQGLCDYYQTKPPKSDIYKDAGFAILRGKGYYLFVSNGGYSKIVSEKASVIITHTHNDLLSFEYSVGEKDIIIDPGTYVYTSERIIRNEFRSTSKHNTVIVDEEEQNVLSNDSMFAVKRNVHINQLDEIEGGVKGSYSTIIGQMTHIRSFIVEKNALIIKDNLIKKGSNHNASFFFFLAEGVEYGRDILIHSSAGKPEIMNSTWSPSYGVMRHNYALRITCSFDENVEVETKIQVL